VVVVAVATDAGVVDAVVGFAGPVGRVTGAVVTDVVDVLGKRPTVVLGREGGDTISEETMSPGTF
jgi:hypothetical protein